MTSLNIDIPEDLHRKLKTKAFKEGYYLKHYVIKLLEMMVK